MPILEYNNLSNSDEDWYCRTCTLPNFSDSYFDHNKSFDRTSDHEISYTGSLSNININIDTRELIQDDEDPSRPNGASNIFDKLIQVRKKHPNKFISSYLNINSLRYKFCSIKELLSRNIVDMLIIAETKLDESFPDAQFRVNNYHLWRNDRNIHGGGLAVYLRSDLASDRKKNLECNKIESICVELYVNNKKWLITGMYRPPSMSDSDFNQDFVKSYDQMSVKYDNLLILGDLNYDLLSDQKSTPLTNVCDICDLENIVKCATCFTKGANPTLIDVILTNRKSLLQNVMNFSCGLSDVHNLIAVQIKSNTPSLKNPYKTYRSYKQFNYEAFIQDLDNAKLNDQIINDNKDIHKTYELLNHPS